MKSMKTAISIPEDIYRDAEDAAKRLGMSRSRLYSEAVADFLNRYRKDDIKVKLNKVHAFGSLGVDPVLAAIQLASLSQEEW
jgi:metal-responsive CopG/Arc/MetJ family transcriptional regulator